MESRLQDQMHWLFHKQPEESWHGPFVRLLRPPRQRSTQYFWHTAQIQTCLFKQSFSIDVI